MVADTLTTWLSFSFGDAEQAATPAIIDPVPSERQALMDLLPEALYRRIVARRLRRVLERRSDRLLADVGFDRERLGEQIAGAVTALVERRRERLRIQRELAAYSDRELEDLGIARRDIPAVARGEMTQVLQVMPANPSTRAGLDASPANDRIRTVAA